MFARIIGKFISIVNNVFIVVCVSSNNSGSISIIHSNVDDVATRTILVLNYYDNTIILYYYYSINKLIS